MCTVLAPTTRGQAAPDLTNTLRKKKWPGRWKKKDAGKSPCVETRALVMMKYFIARMGHAGTYLWLGLVPYSLDLQKYEVDGSSVESFSSALEASSASPGDLGFAPFRTGKGASWGHSSENRLVLIVLISWEVHRSPYAFNPTRGPQDFSMQASS